MKPAIDHNNLHRTAKYFMDNGRVDSADAAIELLGKFGLTIFVGEEITDSESHQTALLTLVNATARTLLGGIEIVGLPDVPCKSRLARSQSLDLAVRHLGGRPVLKPRPDWPAAAIGKVDGITSNAPVWQLTWHGWRAGVIPHRENQRLAEAHSIAVAPALAAAVCAAEVFAYHAGDTAMAGRRSSGMSLWNPGTDWLAPNPGEPELLYLPSRLWLIGLGNLGQAFAWLLAALPYPSASTPSCLLQDFDRVTPANHSTSLLTEMGHVGQRKSRVVADWLDMRGFDTVIEERPFGPWIERTPEEPGTALCGVDNARARAALEKAGFDLIVEAGLGAGPHGFRSIYMHTFPASRTAEEIFSRQNDTASDLSAMPAYQSLQWEGMDDCGLAQLASRTVAVPFVALTAGCLVISELLRRLHRGRAIELIATSALSLEDVEAVALDAPLYPSGHISVTKPAPQR